MSETNFDFVNLAFTLKLHLCATQQNNAKHNLKFSNMPPLVFLYRYENDEAITLQMTQEFSDKLNLNKPELWAFELRDIYQHIKNTNADGYVVAVALLSEDREALLMLIFSQTKNEGCCLFSDTNPRTIPIPISTDDIGMPFLDALIHTQH